MKRREFITLLGGAAAAWPLPVLAQQKERVRRIGVLNTFAAEDPEGQARIAALLQALQPLGWTVGTNLRIEHQSGPDCIIATCGYIFGKDKLSPFRTKVIE